MCDQRSSEAVKVMGAGERTFPTMTNNHHSRLRRSASTCRDHRLTTRPIIGDAQPSGSSPRCQTMTALRGILERPRTRERPGTSGARSFARGAGVVRAVPGGVTVLSRAHLVAVDGKAKEWG